METFGSKKNSFTQRRQIKNLQAFDTQHCLLPTIVVFISALNHDNKLENIQHKLLGTCISAVIFNNSFDFEKKEVVLKDVTKEIQTEKVFMTLFISIKLLRKSVSSPAAGKKKPQGWKCFVLMGLQKTI
jgi:hypothetical protein